jgi:hypothetical protein
MIVQGSAALESVRNSTAQPATLSFIGTSFVTPQLDRSLTNALRQQTDTHLISCARFPAHCNVLILERDS